MLLFYVVVMLFGSFRLNTAGFLRVSLVILVSYFIDILLLKNYRPQSIHVNAELIQLCMLAFILLIISVIGGQISALRQKLAASKKELARSVELISEIAIRDELTGLYNRRYLLELLELEIKRSSRDGSSFCLALLDIDHFKKVNDTYGHPVGDEVLRAVSASMNVTLRKTGFCGRYGGEEFLIVLTKTTPDGAASAMERLRCTIEELQFDGDCCDLMVTASVGLAKHEQGEPIETTISRADAALYQAKKSGRNRVVAMVSGDGPEPGTTLAGPVDSTGVVLIAGQPQSAVGRCARVD